MNFLGAATAQANPQQPLPSTGLGGIRGTPGPANSPAAGAGVGSVVPQPMMGPLGNIGGAMQQAPNWQNARQGGLAGLHPNAIRDLRNLPPGLLQHLHDNGVIHPGLMDHVSRGGMMQ